MGGSSDLAQSIRAIGDTAQDITKYTWPEIAKIAIVSLAIIIGLAAIYKGMKRISKWSKDV